MWCCCFPCPEPNPAERSSLLQQRHASADVPERLSRLVANDSRAAAERSRSDVNKSDRQVAVGELPAHVVMLPTKVHAVDKRFQDHAALYNELVDQWHRLNALLTELRRMFPDRNPQQSLQGTFRHLNQLVAGCESVSVVRPNPQSPCLQVNYDGREVPYETIPAFISYNTAWRYIRELLDKMPSVAQSVRLVVADERQLERDILVASLGRDGPVCVQNCRNDLGLLRLTVLSGIDDIERKTRAVAAELELFAKLRDDKSLVADV